MEKETIEIDSKWVKIVRSPLYWVVAALQGVSITFAPLFQPKRYIYFPRRRLTGLTWVRVLPTFLIRVLLVMAICEATAISLRAEQCSTPDLKLTYPPAANMANMWGDILLHLEIAADGTPAVTSMEWKPNPKIDPPALLATAAKNVALNIRYPLDCGNQAVDLELSYRKKGPIGTPNPGISERVGPNHFQVVTNEWATDQQAVTVNRNKHTDHGWCPNCWRCTTAKG